MSIKKQDIEKLAKLARIELKEGEIGEFTTDISSILSYVTKLQEVKIKKEIEAKDDKDSRLREDEVIGTSNEEQQALLNLVPEKEKNLIKTKPVFE